MKYDFDLEDRSKKRKALLLKILLIGLEVLVVVFLAFAMTHYGYVKMTVTGNTMNPTLKNGDEILIDKMSYHIFGISRNDVVVVKHTGSEHSYYTVERVLGLPGERIQIKKGKLYINKEKIQEKYNYSKMDNSGIAKEEILLDSDEYFLLCDNRNECEDSRNAYIGCISKDQIVGIAWIRTNSLTLISHIDGFKELEKKKGTK